MTHTPGPWSIPHFAVDDCKCNCKYVLAEYGGMGSIATVNHCQSEDYPWGDDEGPDMAQAKANARLIAAAPKLLEALREIATGRDKSGMKSDFPADIARAAISKAEGQTNE